MTGSRYGDYDLHWLLHSLTIDSSGSRLAISAKGVSAVEAYLQSRYHMYRNVYFHKVVRSGRGDGEAGAAAGQAAGGAGSAAPGRRAIMWSSRRCSGQRLSIEEFTDLDDVSVHALLQGLDVGRRCGAGGPCAGGCCIEGSTRRSIYRICANQMRWPLWCGRRMQYKKRAVIRRTKCCTMSLPMRRLNLIPAMSRAIEARMY